MLCHVLAEIGDHLWLAFRKPVDEAGGGRISTHYVVCSDEEATLIDPGGTADFPLLLNAVTEKIDLSRITGIVITQASSHTCGSVGFWAEVLGFDTPVHAPEIIVSELLHIDPELNIRPTPQTGGEITLSNGASLHLLAAPYLPTAASLSLYDPAVRLLYTGEIGTAEGPWAEDQTPFCDTFSPDRHEMNGFHQTWLASGAARDDWVHRVRALDIDIVAPGAGPCFQADNIDLFMEWFAALDVGGLITNHQKSRAGRAGFANKLDPDTHPTFGRLALNQLAQSDDDIFTQLANQRRDAATDDDPPPISVATYEAPGQLEKSGDDADEISRLIDAIGDDQDENGEYEIVYVDEDGNEIDPGEIENSQLIEAEEIIEGNDETRLRFPPEKMFRLITRCDFDGLVCAVLFEELDLINDIVFVHPNEMQEGRISVSDDDISANLPYTPGIFAAFDHHLSEVKRLGKHYENHIIDPRAPSAARVVYDYFGGKKCFSNIAEEMMDAVDKADAAQFSVDEVIHANRWSLLNFIMDPRTGFGRYGDFRVPHYELMMSLIDHCRRDDIEDILAHPDVSERVVMYRAHEELAKEQIERCAILHDNLVVLDLRQEEQTYVVNRFMVYALFPQCNISMQMLWGRARQTTVFAVGKSIFNKTSNTNVGELMLAYGGGGHRNAGTCQSDNAETDTVRDTIIKRINADG